MDKPVTVLQSFPAPRPTSVNPYTLLLAEHLRATPGITVLNFSWRTALLARYDVFHAHWPEILVDGHSPLKKLVRQVFTVALLTRLRMTRTPIVRTVHNLELPRGISRRERWLLGAFDRQTTLRIRLNTTTPLPDGEPSATIPQGHYRDWFADYPKREAVAGQFGYVGRIRQYKGVENLVEAFRQTAGSDLRLRVGGYPSSPELADTVTRLAGGDPRIELTLGFISDAQFVDIATSSQLVVLPYRLMHNSAAAVTVLSLDCPVLVPKNEVNELLSAEVGTGWVYSFEGDLTAETLEHTLQLVNRDSDRRQPEFGERDWTTVAAAHADAYRRAIDWLRARR